MPQNLSVVQKKLNMDSNNILIKGARDGRESHQNLNFFLVNFSPLNRLAVKRFSAVEIRSQKISFVAIRLRSTTPENSFELIFGCSLINGHLTDLSG